MQPTYCGGTRVQRHAVSSSISTPSGIGSRTKVISSLGVSRSVHLRCSSQEAKNGHHSPLSNARRRGGGGSYLCERATYSWLLNRYGSIVAPVRHRTQTRDAFVGLRVSAEETSQPTQNRIDYVHVCSCWTCLLHRHPTCCPL